MPEYLISDGHAPFGQGGHWYDALRTHGESWKELRDSLSPDVCHYAFFDAPNKRDAIWEARRRWPN